MLCKRFIALLGLVVGSYVAAAAQSPSQYIATVHEPPAPLPSSVSQNPTGSGALYLFSIAEAPERDHSLASVFPIEPETGSILGTVIDVNGDAVPVATVILEGASLSDRRSVVTNENGFFQLKDLNPGTPFHIGVTASGFTDWTSREIILEPGQVLDLTDVNLRIATVVTTVVAVSSEQPALEQVRVEEKQRVFGVIPAFYVVYDHDAVAPLTTKLKFRLALRTSVDPFTFLGAAFLAGLGQAADTPKYVQGAKGYGERVGAVYAKSFTNILIGGAILPSLLHQDPRYFYQGTGTKKSRILHALSSAFICKGDSGRWQPNYSSVGAALASSAISNAYYPAANRGLGPVFQSTLLTIGFHMADTLMKEFLLGKPKTTF
jgi:Carboxypeptidase regulatory-like domain